MFTRISIYFTLWFVIMVAGCNKIESKKQREKAQTEIFSTLGAIRNSFEKLEETSQSFKLVHQPESEITGRESLWIQRVWVFALSEQSLSKEDKTLLISSCRSVLKKYVPADTEKLKYDLNVKDEGEHVRISLVAKWNKEPN